MEKKNITQLLRLKARPTISSTKADPHNRKQCHPFGMLADRSFQYRHEHLPNERVRYAS